MVLDLLKVNYTGRIREITLGNGPHALTVGGETCYPFHTFEGEMPRPPAIAMEVYDTSPEDWPAAAIEPFRDVVNDPVRWAQKCHKEFGAEAICLQLVSTDPNGLNRPADEAADVVAQVATSLDTPLIVWGTANKDKDAEVLREVCERCQGQNLAVGPVEEANYKKIGAAAIGYGHIVVASSPIDVNIAKQLNILLGNLGVPDNRILIDPTVSSIGYGIEYCYSVMERIRTAALVQGDDKLQYPIIANIAKETWKAKEVKIATDENPALGDASNRGILLEAMSATLMLLGGADILIMRHPEAIKLVRGIIRDLTTPY